MFNQSEYTNIKWPSNFYVYKYVNQLLLLENTHIFITHCGYNSFNEALLKKVPMIGIPFFGDQLIVADRIKDLKLGIVLPLLNTYHGCSYDRDSLNEDYLKLIIKKIDEKHYNYLMRILKYNWGYFDICNINKLYYNYLVNWKNGDLLYGMNNDRDNFVVMSKMSNEFRLDYERPYSQIFSERRETNLLPRIVEYYTTPLVNNNYYPVESSTHFIDYSKNLKEFKEWIVKNIHYLDPLKNFNDIDEDNVDKIKNKLSIAGINFFCLEKGYNIHFVMETLEKLDGHALDEFNYIKQNWEKLGPYISFYNCHKGFGILTKINPKLYLW